MTASSTVADAAPASDERTTVASSRRLAFVVTALVVLPFLGWWTYGFFDLDEGFYAAIVREMIRRHEWITPYYNGQPWYEKPILIYWAAKPAMMLFGGEFGARLPSVLATWATIGLAAWFARRRLAAGTALIAPLVLASSLLVVGVGRMMLTDPLLVLCLSATLIWFWESLVGNPRWRLAAAAALGLAVLAKGPVSIAFFVLIGAYTWWRERELRPRFRGGWVVGTIVFTVIAGSWYYPVYLADPGNFVHGFIVEQNINRFLGGDTAHTVPGLTNLVAYFPVVLLGMVPWSLFLWRAWPRRSRDASSAAAARRFLATWATTVFVFFTVSGSKLPHYMLPTMLPLALLVADDMARRWGTVDLRRLVRPGIWVLAVALIAEGGFTVYYYGVDAGPVHVPGFHAELHRVAAFVKAHAVTGDAVIEYQTGRQQAKPLATPLKVIETSHPSLRYYLDRAIPLTDDMQQVLAQDGTVWLITRGNRIGDAERAAAAAARRPFARVPTPFAQVHYALWRLAPAGAE